MSNKFSIYQNLRAFKNCHLTPTHFLDSYKNVNVSSNPLTSFSCFFFAFSFQIISFEKVKFNFDHIALYTIFPIMLHKCFLAIFIELFENLLISVNVNHVLAYKDQCITFLFFSYQFVASLVKGNFISKKCDEKVSLSQYQFLTGIYQLLGHWKIFDNEARRQKFALIYLRTILLLTLESLLIVVCPRLNVNI